MLDYEGTENIITDYRFSKKFIRFIVDDINMINVTDIFDGEVHDSLVIKENLNISIIFQPKLHYEKGKVYYFNKLISILYY